MSDFIASTSTLTLTSVGMLSTLVAILPIELSNSLLSADVSFAAAVRGVAAGFGASLLGVKSGALMLKSPNCAAL